MQVNSKRNDEEILDYAKSEIPEIFDLTDFCEIPETGLPTEQVAVLGLPIFSYFEFLNYY